MGGRRGGEGDEMVWGVFFTSGLGGRNGVVRFFLIFLGLLLLPFAPLLLAELDDSFN